MTASLDCLYSFRRCPYAMRARLGVWFSGLQVELREVTLKNKPAQMLAISPKGTVPVLRLADGAVIEESRDIVVWALEQQDPQGLLDATVLDQANALIEQNDNEFKYWLDRYKYVDRHPHHTAKDCRKNAEVFIQKLEDQLSVSDWVGGEAANAVDVALFPFIRQFAGVEPSWWQQAPYPKVRQWLKNWLNSALFFAIMAKYPRWESGQPGERFPPEPDHSAPT